MRRQSTGSNSDASSTYSASTTYSYAKEPLLEKDGSSTEHKRGLRQKARDVVSDLGKPPTMRQDKKEGKHTSNFADPGFLGDLMRPTKM